MDLKRFFSDDVDFEKKSAVLTDDEFYHAVKVTRHKVGYKLIISCGDAYDYYCTVTDISKDALYAEIDERKPNDAETGKDITLYIGANKDLDTVVQKAVEMGVNRVVPFTSKRSNVDKINIDRLNKIVLESAKQCGRNYLPMVAPLVNFDVAMSMAKGSDILFYYEYERNNKTSEVIFSDKPISIFIGSEGGFSLEEREKAIGCGAHVLTLGKRILRVSTAVVAALGLTIEKIGEI